MATTETTTKPAKLKAQDVANAMLNHLLESGWVSETDLRAFGMEFSNGDTNLVHSGLRLLARTGNATPKSGPHDEDGWEAVGAKQRRSGAQYLGYDRPIEIAMVLRTPALGQVADEPGDECKRFHLERDADGEVMFSCAQFFAMLEKAHMQADLPDRVPTPQGGYDDVEIPSRESVRRWHVIFQGVDLPEAYRGPAVGPLPVQVRRPLNVKGASVGVLFHESLPVGTRIRWRVSWPTSHWHPAQAMALLDAAQQVGFSPAGNGKYGGLRGLFRLEVKVDAPPVPAPVNGQVPAQSSALVLVGTAG